MIRKFTLITQRGVALSQFDNAVRMNLFLFIWLILPLGLAEVTNTLFDEVLPDRWIVVLNPNTTHTPFSFLSGLSQRLPGDVNHTNVYHWDGFSGFAASMSSSVAELLLGADEVKSALLAYRM